MENLKDDKSSDSTYKSKVCDYELKAT